MWINICEGLESKKLQYPAAKLQLNSGFYVLQPCHNCTERSVFICIQVNTGVMDPCLSWCNAIWWPARTLPLRYHRTFASKATGYFQSAAGSLQLPHPWPDLNKVYTHTHTHTLTQQHSRQRTNTRWSLIAEKTTHIIDSVMGLMSSPTLFSWVSVTYSSSSSCLSFP